MIEAVQRGLDERGYDPGEVDGLTGWRTRDALREFQRSAGLPDTGQVDDATLAALGLVHPDDVEPEAGPDAPEAGTPQDEEPAPVPGIPGREAPKAGTPAAKPSAEPGSDTSGAKPSAEPDSDTSGAKPSAEPDSDTSGAKPSAEPDSDTSGAKPSAEPGSDTSGAEAPRSESAPERTPARRLSFATLGWHPPQTGADTLARFNAIGAPPGFKRGTETLVVPKGELIFVLKVGERIPDIDCDPDAGGLSIEFIFGPDGPVIFTPAADGGYCQAGIGIVLAVGRTLEMGRVDWGDVQYPRGTVRITNRGLEYVR